MLRPSAGALFVFAAAIAIAGCSTGSNTYFITAQPTPVLQVTAAPVTQGSPFTQTATVPVANNALAMPVTNGYSPSLSFGAGSLVAGTNVSATVTNQAPGGVNALARHAMTTGFASDAVVYLGLDFSLSTNASGAITATTTIPSGVVPSGYNLWLALYDPTITPTAWQYGVAGPSQLSNGGVTFTIGGGYAFTASQQYWLAVYALPTTYVTPSPAPAAIAVSPTSLSLSGTGSANAKSFSVTEPGYKGSFQVSSGNASVATVSPLSGLGPSVSFAVTPTGGGTTTITVSDSNGQSATVSVGVTAGTVTVSGGPQ